MGRDAPLRRAGPGRRARHENRLIRIRRATGSRPSGPTWQRRPPEGLALVPHGRDCADSGPVSAGFANSATGGSAVRAAKARPTAGRATNRQSQLFSATPGGKHVLDVSPVGPGTRQEIPWAPQTRWAGSRPSPTWRTWARRPSGRAGRRLACAGATHAGTFTFRLPQKAQGKPHHRLFFLKRQKRQTSPGHGGPLSGPHEDRQRVSCPLHHGSRPERWRASAQLRTPTNTRYVYVLAGDAAGRPAQCRTKLDPATPACGSSNTGPGKPYTLFAYVQTRRSRVQGGEGRLGAEGRPAACWWSTSGRFKEHLAGNAGERARGRWQQGGRRCGSRARASWGRRPRGGGASLAPRLLDCANNAGRLSTKGARGSKGNPLQGSDEKRAVPRAAAGRLGEVARTQRGQQDRHMRWRDSFQGDAGRRGRGRDLDFRVIGQTASIDVTGRASSRGLRAGVKENLVRAGQSSPAGRLQQPKIVRYVGRACTPSTTTRAAARASCQPPRHGTANSRLLGGGEKNRAVRARPARRGPVQRTPAGQGAQGSASASRATTSASSWRWGQRADKHMGKRIVGGPVGELATLPSSPKRPAFSVRRLARTVFREGWAVPTRRRGSEDPQMKPRVSPRKRSRWRFSRASPSRRLHHVAGIVHRTIGLRGQTPIYHRRSGQPRADVSC